MSHCPLHRASRYHVIIVLTNMTTVWVPLFATGFIAPVIQQPPVARQAETIVGTKPENADKLDVSMWELQR